MLIKYIIGIEVQSLSDTRILGIPRLPWIKLGAKVYPRDTGISFKGLTEMIKRSGYIGY